MDILYIVGEGSKHDNAELRWSLRSLAKHGRNVARVLVAGCPPAWLSGDVESLTVPDVDLPGKKNRSIVNCVLKAVRSFDLKGDFVFGCDDVFLAEPVDFDRYPLYIDDDGLPDALPSSRKASSFDELLVATRRFLLDHGAPVFRFQTHAFCRMSADVIRANEKLLRSTVTDSVRGLEILSLVGNLTLKANPDTPLLWRRDVKFGEAFKLPTDPFCRGQFSISDKTFSSSFFQYFMQNTYGGPCRYEKESPLGVAGLSAPQKGAL